MRLLSSAMATAGGNWRTPTADPLSTIAAAHFGEAWTEGAAISTQRPLHGGRNADDGNGDGDNDDDYNDEEGDDDEHM